MSVTFDTLKLIKKLKESGFNEMQAETLSEIFRDVSSENMATLSTKQDLRETELKIENKIESLRGEISLLKWMMGFVLAGIVSLVLKTFFMR